MKKKLLVRFNKEDILMIMACSCNHGFQDEIYGVGNRVYNRGKKVSEVTETSADGKTKKIKAKTYTYRCSVCLKEQNATIKGDQK